MGGRREDGRVEGDYAVCSTFLSWLKKEKARSRLQMSVVGCSFGWKRQAASRNGRPRSVGA